MVLMDRPGAQLRNDRAQGRRVVARICPLFQGIASAILANLCRKQYQPLLFPLPNANQSRPSSANREDRSGVFRVLFGGWARIEFGESPRLG